MRHNREQDAKGRRLDFVAIFFILAAFAASLYLSLNDKLSSIRFTQKELLGIRVHEALFDLQFSMEHYRSQVFLSRYSAQEMRQFSEARKNVEERLDSVNQLFESPDFEEFPRVRGRWQLAKVGFTSFSHENINYTALEEFEDRTEIIERMDLLMRDVGAESNLILEPELDPYFMISLMINNIPRATEYVSYLMGKTSGLLSQGNISIEDEYDLLTYLSRQSASSGDYLYALSMIKSARHDTNSDYSAEIAAAQQLRRFHEIFPKIIGRRETMSSTDFFAEGEASIQALTKSYKSLLYKLKDRLEERIAVLEWHIVMVLTGSVCMLVLAVMAVVIARRNVTRKSEVESARHINAIIKTALDAIMTIDSQGILQSFNPAAEKLFGYNAQEVIGKNVDILMPEPYHTEHDQYMRNYLTTGKKKVLGRVREVEAKKKNGTVFPIELVVSEFEYAGNKGFVGSIRDISTRKESEQQQQVLIQKLTSANSELERFAYVASHDMQEPIRMVSNFCALLADEYRTSLDETGIRYLDIITSSAQRMQLIISDLLEYARTGADVTHFKTINCQEELLHVIENLCVLIQERGAKVTYDALPEIEGNAVQVMRLLQNLVGNGLKYQAHDVLPKVHVGAQDKGGHWLFSVKDNGIGIEKKYHDSIFEPFKRLHSWQQYKGTGIGLAICKKIVENHGGKIWVESSPGEGCTFYFTLPKSHEVTEQ